jgi:hypothetical protein
MSKKDDHQKYYNQLGLEVPSVTTVLKILNKPELIGWANYMGFKKKKVKDILEETSYIGTCVHELISKSSHSIFVNIKPYKDNKEIMNCYYAFKKWKNDYDIEPLNTEMSLSCIDYGGTIDCIAEMHKMNAMILIDYKTSSNIYASMFLQLAGYIRLLQEHEYKIKFTGIVRLDKKIGKYDFVYQPIDYLSEYIDLFNKLVDIYKQWTYLLKYDWGKEFDT